MKQLHLFSLKKLIFITLCVVITLFTTNTNTFAQETDEGVSLTVSPYLLDLRTQPGSIVKDKIRLYNNLSKDLKLSPQVRPLKPEGEQGGAVPSDKITDADIHLEWLSFEDQSVTAISREWVDVPFTIEVPEDAAFGHYYAISFIPDTTSSSPEDGAQTVLQGQITVFVLLTVEKEGAKAEISLVSFDPIKTLFEYLPIKFQTRVENTGNVHIRPGGNIFIRQPGTSTDIAILNINDTNGNVLPGTKRVFETSWNDGFISKNEQNGQLVFHWDKLLSFRLGQYEARLALVYFDGTKDILIDNTKTFYIIPYTAISIILVSLIIIGLGIRFLLKAYVRSQLRKLNQTQTSLRKDRIK